MGHCLAELEPEAYMHSLLEQSDKVLRGKERIPFPDNVLDIFLGVKETQIVKEQLMKSS